MSHLSQIAGTMKNAITHMVRFAKTTTNPVTAKGVATVQVRHQDSTTHEVINSQQYGFASSLLPGCDVTLTCNKGDNSNSIIVASNDNRYRPILANGEVRIHDAYGNYVSLRSGSISVHAAGSLTIDAVQITTFCDIVIVGKSFLQPVHGGVQ